MRPRNRFCLLTLSLTIIICIISNNVVWAQSDLAEILAPGATVEKALPQVFTFLEGPAWDGRGACYFTDTRLGDIWKVDLQGNATLVRDKAQYDEGANGLMFDADGNLVICERFAGRIAVAKPDGTPVRVWATHWNGRNITNPNDLCLDGRGGVYFSNPTGRSTPKEDAPKGIYYCNAAGEVSLVCGEDLGMPNGMHVSADGATLYVADTREEELWAYDIQPGGAVTNKRVFCTLKISDEPDRDGNPQISLADGLTIDEDGRVYVTTRIGVQIFDKNGQPVGIIEVPESPANCAFGGPDNNILYMTARTSLYQIKLQVAGGYRDQFAQP
jgi:gluconolactonase